jgi:putative Holliday junction resolvase
VALDYGRRRIGVAISDPGRILATPHAVVEHRAGIRTPPAELIALLRDLEPAEILLGIPLNMDGSEGEMALESRRFGAGIREQLEIPVIERDERLSSIEADRRLKDSGLPRGKRRQKGRRDMMAATVLLEDYLAEN